ncbi:phage holin [Plantibacter sp. RU18]|uniref:phage holin n=1 Tax=Plantibacter sp. RU18 TaxID=3158143 RepID=UPI002CDB61BF|nr:hypothetical protein [Gemmatimonadaceae bacterium]
MTISKPSRNARAYLYRILLAATPLATGYGLLTHEQAALWLGLATAILGLSLAAANTTPTHGRHAKR